MHGRTASLPIAAVTLPIGCTKLGRSAKNQYPAFHPRITYDIVWLLSNVPRRCRYLQRTKLAVSNFRLSYRFVRCSRVSRASRSNFGQRRSRYTQRFYPSHTRRSPQRVFCNEICNETAFRISFSLPLSVSRECFTRMYPLSRKNSDEFIGKVWKNRDSPVK